MGPGDLILEDIMEIPGDPTGHTSSSQDSTPTEPCVQNTTKGEVKEDTEYITGFKLIAVVGSVTLVCFLLLLDQSILSTAIPQITSAFHSVSDIGWYTGVYQLASAALQPLTGKIYTFYKAKWIFLIFVFIFELGSTLCGAAQSSTMLIVGRAIAGLGASGLINGGITVIAGVSPLEKRPLYTGIMIGIGQIGLISGPLIGGALTEYTTWRWCFFINLPLGGLTVLFIFLIKIPDITIKDPFSFALVREVLPRLDLIGFSIFTPAIIMLLLALQFGGGNTFAWNSSRVIDLFCGAGVMAILFVIWEAHVGDEAMLPGSVIRRRVVWASCGQVLGLMCCVFVASTYFPLYFQAVKGVGPTTSGVYMLPSILSQLLLVVVSGAGVSKLGYYLPWVIVSCAITAVGNGLVSTFSPTTSTGKWIGYQFLLGAGRGCGLQMSMIAVQNALPPDQIPVGLALLIFCQNVGAAVSVVIATTIFTQNLVSNARKLAPSVPSSAVLGAGGGAGEIRNLVPPGSPELSGLVQAYSNSFDKIFYLLAGFAVASFAFAWGMGFLDIREKKTEATNNVKRTNAEKVAETEEV